VATHTSLQYKNRFEESANLRERPECIFIVTKIRNVLFATTVTWWPHEILESLKETNDIVLDRAQNTP
jgi:hypothetical protein